MISEKDMEDAIVRNSTKYLESGLRLIKRQHRVGNYIFDLLFEDRHGAKLIVEVQKGTLDRNHTYKIMDYYDEYKERNPGDFIELMVIANKIPDERKKRLAAWGVAYKEIPIDAFLMARTTTDTISEYSDVKKAESNAEECRKKKVRSDCANNRSNNLKRGWDHNKLGNQDGQINEMIKKGCSVGEMTAEFNRIYPDHENPRGRVLRHIRHLINDHDDFPFQLKDNKLVPSDN